MSLNIGISWEMSWIPWVWKSFRVWSSSL